MITLECTACGVCCTSNLETYVRLNGADWDRLGAEGQSLAHFVGNRAYMRMSGGACAALVQIGQPGQVGYSTTCRIFERRPQTCRDLGRGSKACAGEIWAKAPPALNS